MSDADSQRRTIRSFVRRTGRITPAQQKALIDLWPRYGIEFSLEVLDLDAVFGRAAERVLEIGFGNGGNLVHEAAGHPGTDYLGVEVHEPGIGHCLIGAHDLDLSNLRVIRHDAIEVLQYQIGDASLARIVLYFPDPWPKKRHHKRRIVQAAFLQQAARKLAVAGTLQIATDWENYAEHIDAAISASADFIVSERREHTGNDEAAGRQTTKFERRGLQKGHRIWDWRLTRK